MNASHQSVTAPAAQPQIVRGLPPQMHAAGQPELLDLMHGDPDQIDDFFERMFAD